MHNMDKQTLRQKAEKLFDRLKGGGKGEKKKPSPVVIFIIALAALALIFVRPTDRKAPTTAGDKAAVSPSYDSEYAAKMEEELKYILERISGAGDVSVSIYIDSTAEKVLAKDSKTQSEISESDSGKKETSSGESRPVTGSGGLGGGEPYVVREKLPYPIGVVVVASGARNENVKNEIYEAVKALYGLSANRIKVTY